MTVTYFTPRGGGRTTAGSNAPGAFLVNYKHAALGVLMRSGKELFTNIKPWPNGVASYLNLKTCGNLRLLRLATSCADLRWLASTLMEIKFARKQVFNRLATQRKSTQVGFSIVCLCTGNTGCGAGLRKINSEVKGARHLTNVLFCYSFVIQ